jgi:hypothetical protein
VVVVVVAATRGDRRVDADQAGDPEAAHAGARHGLAREVRVRLVDAGVDDRHLDAARREDARAEREVPALRAVEVGVVGVWIPYSSPKRGSFGIEVADRM